MYRGVRSVITGVTVTTAPGGARLDIASGTFPLSVDATGRHLVTAAGAPFFAVSDSPQGLFVNVAPSDNVTTTDAGVYLNGRKTRGFNTIWSNILCGTGTGGRSDYSTYDGITPFTGTVGGFPDLTTPRATYWARMDAIVALATAYGFLVIINPCETISIRDIAVANGATRCSTYGAWIGARYASYPNVIWIHGNDYQNWPVSDSVLIPIADGIRSSMPGSLQSVQLDFFDSDSGEDSAWWSHIDYDAVYAYTPQYTTLRAAYNRTGPVRPLIFVEGSYEHEHNSGTPAGTPLEIRRQMYWTLTNGGTGTFYGEAHLWGLQVGNSWQDYLSPTNSPAVTHVGKFAALHGQIAWSSLVPDQSNTFLTANYSGTPDPTDGLRDYATAAKSADGHHAVVYVPWTTNVTCNLALMAGAVTAQWYDPTNGTYTSAGSSLSGSHSFTHPGNNSAGDPDRVLVLEA
jgi:hypothetical protein